MKEEFIQYIGIAIDEPKRLARLKNNQISLLAKYGYTENMAAELCRKYNLLSPIYETGTRGGCWFCPNAKISALAHLRSKHPELWQELETLSHTENLCSHGFKWGLTLQEVAIKIDRYNDKQKEVMNIRNIQLSLFDPEPNTRGGERAAWGMKSLNRQNGVCTSKTETAAMCAAGALNNSEKMAAMPKL